MSEFSRWLAKKYPEYLLEQEDTSMQQTPPAQTTTEKLRQRLERDKQNKTPDQKAPDQKAPDQGSKIKQYLQQKQAGVQPDQDNIGAKLRYRPEEIIIIKNVIPKQLIRNAQFDTNKWDKDFENLQKPSEGDIGFATSKEFFDKPVRMLVVTRSGLTRVMGASTAAYFNHSTRTMVMPDNAFIQLPTATSDGKLKPDGVHTLAHELRHTTQQGETPFHRSQGAVGFIGGEPSQKYSFAWVQYLNDPKEMGVRLAAIKNYMSKESLFKIADSNFPKDNRDVDLGHTYAKQLIAFLPEDEKRIFHYILHPKEWSDAFAKEKNSSPQQSKILLETVNRIIGILRKQNRDINSLLDFYYFMDVDRDKDFLEMKQEAYKELMDAYDRVVKNKSQYNQPAYG